MPRLRRLCAQHTFQFSQPSRYRFFDKMRVYDVGPDKRWIYLHFTRFIRDRITRTIVKIAIYARCATSQALTRRSYYGICISFLFIFFYLTVMLCIVFLFFFYGLKHCRTFRSVVKHKSHVYTALKNVHRFVDEIIFFETRCTAPSRRRNRFGSGAIVLIKFSAAR